MYLSICNIHTYVCISTYVFLYIYIKCIKTEIWEETIAISYNMLQPHVGYLYKLQRPATNMGAGSDGRKKRKKKKRKRSAK